MRTRQACGNAPFWEKKRLRSTARSSQGAVRSAQPNILHMEPKPQAISSSTTPKDHTSAPRGSMGASGAATPPSRMPESISGGQKGIVPHRWSESAARTSKERPWEGSCWGAPPLLGGPQEVERGATPDFEP